MKYLVLTGTGAGSADKGFMSTPAINPISAATLEQALDTVENAATTSIATVASSTTVANSARQSDSSQFSPLGQLISTLQHLQKTDPTKYKEVTQLIATNLQTTAQTAKTQGNSSEAKQLTALAADFSSASNSGNLSTLVKDLTPAGGRHHHGSGIASTNSVTENTGNQLLSLLHGNESQRDQSTNLKATATILHTLNASGITTP
jgi:uncharacterized protein YidB (DUF937 family)